MFSSMWKRVLFTSPTCVMRMANSSPPSRATVSLILNHRGPEQRISPQTCRRVLALAGELRYCRNEIARSLVAGRTNMIGFLAQWAASQHCALLLSGVMQAASRLGVMVKVMSMDGLADVDKVVNLCRGYRLAGLIAYEMSSPPFFTELRKRLARHGIPVRLEKAAAAES